MNFFDVGIEWGEYNERYEKVRLVKSRTNKLLTGVCGGIGELIGIDPTIIRLIWAALSLAGGSGVILYILAAVIIPEDDDIIDSE